MLCGSECVIQVCALWICADAPKSFHVNGGVPHMPLESNQYIKNLIQPVHIVLIKE